MSKLRLSHPAEFRQLLFELMRGVRTPVEQLPEFNVTAWSTTNWVGLAAIDSGKVLPAKKGLSMD